MLVTRFFRYLHFNRFKPKTRCRRWVRRFEQFLFALTLVFIGLYIFPQVLFPHSLSVEGVTIYARFPLPSITVERITEIIRLTKRSELLVIGRTERIFICNQPWLFRLFSPTNADAFAYSLPVTDNIFFAHVDLADNISRSTTPEFNVRFFSAVAAHEITHGLISHEAGVLNNPPDWVTEGYCDYIADESSFS